MIMKDMPRKCHINLLTPMEKAIRDALEAVEAGGADPLLTDAVSLLSQAGDKVAVFVDRQMVEATLQTEDLNTQ